ncbi:MAG: Ldh family oxidoreductase [Actinomycetes bacterium]
MNIAWATMSDWTASIFEAVGLDRQQASQVAANLEYAERRGFASHGYMRLGVYVERIKAGGIRCRPEIKVVTDFGAMAVVDSDSAAGAVSAIFCTDLAISKAAQHGVGVVIASSANHFGAAGYYTDRMTAAGLAGVVSCNTDAVMCAPFGGRPVLGTNPLSIAVPVSERCGPQLDMATTEASYGKILLARDRNETLPIGWAVDEVGNATSDPAAALKGALLPAGGPKGFGLAFMLDCLIAIGGAATSDHVGALYGDPTKPQELGHLFLAMRVDAVSSAEVYSNAVGDLVKAVRASGTPSGRTPMAPGEPELARLAAADWQADLATIQMYRSISLDSAVAVPDVPGLED